MLCGECKSDLQVRASTNFPAIFNITLPCWGVIHSVKDKKDVLILFYASSIYEKSKYTVKGHPHL